MELVKSHSTGDRPLLLRLSHKHEISSQKMKKKTFFDRHIGYYNCIRWSKYSSRWIWVNPILKRSYIRTFITTQKKVISVYFLQLTFLSRGCCCCSLKNRKKNLFYLGGINISFLAGRDEYKHEIGFLLWCPTAALSTKRNRITISALIHSLSLSVCVVEIE